MPDSSEGAAEWEKQLAVETQGSDGLSKKPWAAIAALRPPSPKAGMAILESAKEPSLGEAMGTKQSRELARASGRCPESATANAVSAAAVRGETETVWPRLGRWSLIGKARAAKARPARHAL